MRYRISQVISVKLLMLFMYRYIIYQIVRRDNIFVSGDYILYIKLSFLLIFVQDRITIFIIKKILRGWVRFPTGGIVRDPWR